MIDNCLVKSLASHLFLLFVMSRLHAILLLGSPFRDYRIVHGLVWLLRLWTLLSEVVLRLRLLVWINYTGGFFEGTIAANEDFMVANDVRLVLCLSHGSVSSCRSWLLMLLFLMRILLENFVFPALALSRHWL